jgi:hypothetical protein
MKNVIVHVNLVPSSYLELMDEYRSARRSKRFIERRGDDLLMKYENTCPSPTLSLNLGSTVRSTGLTSPPLTVTIRTLLVQPVVCPNFPKQR